MTTWQQGGLFDPMYGGLPPHQKHSDTSKAAAIGLSASRRDTLCAMVYRYIAQTAGAIDEEIQSALNLNGNTERPRRCELLEAGLIKDSGLRRLTRTGRKAVVWVVKAA